MISAYFGMTGFDDNDTETAVDLTPLVASARSGRRRDVQPLVKALPEAQLFVPLAEDLAGAPEGHRVTLSSKLELIPHILCDADRRTYVPLFTRIDLVSVLKSTLGWMTDGDELKLCSLPAAVALQMALGMMDDGEVFAVVINPAQDAELTLTARELHRILKGEAIPLVGYVQRIVDGEEQAETLVAEAMPVPPELVAKLTEELRNFPDISGYSLRQTFNADRDLEPHLTLELVVGKLPKAAGEQIARHLVAQIEDKLPPPHYIDILFRLADG